MMKKFPVLLILILFAVAAPAQIKLNPKFGPAITGLASADDQFEFNSGWGFTAGGDVRIGDKFLFITGAYWQSHAAELIAVPVGNNPSGYSEEINYQKVHFSFLAAYQLNLVAVKMRLGLGTSYSKMTYWKARPNAIIDKDLLDPNMMGVDALVGVDVLFISADLHFSYGFNSFIPEIDGSNPWWLGLNVGITLL